MKELRLGRYLPPKNRLAVIFANKPDITSQKNTVDQFNRESECGR
jgi:hypothetical protein